MPKINLSGKSQLELYAGTVLQTKGQVTVTDRLLYVSRDRSRSYWRSNLPLAKRPKVTFNDKAQSFRIASNRVVVKRKKDYSAIKKTLQPWIRK